MITKLEAIKLMLEIVTVCDKYDSENLSCKDCPFGDSTGTCMAADGNDIPHYWAIKYKLNNLGSEVKS